MVRAAICSRDGHLVALLRWVLQGDDHLVEHVLQRQDLTALVLQTEPDVALIDLPHLTNDGLEFCRNMASSTRSAVVVLCRQSCGNTEQAVLETGALACIAEPLALFRGDLAAILYASDAVQPPLTLRRIAPGLKLDIVGKRAFKDGREISLTPKEFRLLLHLAVSARRIVSTEELITVGWGSVHAADPGQLYVQIAKLRSKLEDDRKLPRLIIHRRGTGYVFTGHRRQKSRAKRWRR